MAALGSQSIASSYEQLLHVDRDGGGNTTTHVNVKDGDNGTTFGFTIASDALMMTSTNRLEFGDTGTYIHQSADGVLDLVSDTEIEINATTIDMNGALDLSGNAQLSGTVTVGADGSGTDVIFYSGTAGDNFSWDASEEKLTITGTNGQTALDVADGNLVVADNVDIEGDIDVNGTTNLDAVDIDGAVQIDAAFTSGVDGQGYDTKFFGDTASAYMMWDTSADDLVFAGAAGIDLDGDIDVNGTANLDNTDIDGTLAVDGTTISLDATTSLNIDNSNTSNGITIGTATSGVPISIGHTTSETTVNDNLVVTGDIDLAGSIDVNGTANLDVVDIDGAVNMAADLTTTADIKIDSDTKGLVLGADQDAAIFSNAAGVLTFVRGTDLTPVGSDTEGWQVFGMGDSAESYHSIIGGEGGTAALNLYADGLDDNDDGYKIEAHTNGNLYIQTLSSGSFATNMQIDGSIGAVTKPVQPAFLAHSSSDQSNIAEGTTITVVFDTEIFDQGSNFASNTFTAPVTGKYLLNFNIALEDIDSAADNYSITITTSNRTYTHFIFDPDFGQDNSFYNQAASVLADMDASDTAIVTVRQNGGSQQTDLGGGATKTFFSGYLAC